MITRLAAGLLISHPRQPGQILMVEPSYKNHWDIPGGEVEAGELPTEAAEREAKEELGIVVPAGRLLVVDTIVSADSKRCLIAFIFDGGTVNGGGRKRKASDPARTVFTVNGTEITSWKWCDMAQRSERLLTAPLLQRRLNFAITAKETGNTSYIDHRAAQ